MAWDVSLELAPLATLVAIADAGTVTEAARRLSLSQPAATHQIRQLERRLGIALFERRGRYLVLTDAGRLAVARGRRIMAEIAALHEDLRSLEGLEHGLVRLGGGTTAVVHLLPRRIAGFRQDHPGVSFHVKEGPAPVIAEAVANGELDVGIVMLPCPQAGLVVRPWAREAIRFVGWPGCELARRPFSPERLNEVPFLHAGADMPLRAAVAAALREVGVQPRAVMELHSIEAIKAHVAEGLGYAALGEHAVAADLAVGRLVSLSPRGLAPYRDLGLVLRPGDSLAPAATAFMTYLLANPP